MLIVKEDKTKDVSEGQIFVELINNIGTDVINCDRLGYWCDKAHLSHFLTEIGKIFTEEEKIKLLGIKTEAKSDFITLNTINSNKVSLRKDDIIPLMLEFYMGKNTPERQEYIIDNLREEIDE